MRILLIATCGIQFPDQGIELGPPALGTWSSSHREVLGNIFKHFLSSWLSDTFSEALLVIASFSLDALSSVSSVLTLGTLGL